MAAAKRLQAAQAKALAFEATPMDSGVPAEVAHLLIDLKSALADASDEVVDCSSSAETPAVLQSQLNAFLREAAPGLPVPKQPVVYDEKAIDRALVPAKGQFGNEVIARVQELSSPARLLEVTISNDVTCGTDSQLLIYQRKDGRWIRALRWSSDFGNANGSTNSWIASQNGAWGDFFLTGILTPDSARPEQWRAVVAHGTPWCTSRMSGFGLAVLASGSDGQARILWQTERGYSRFEFEPRLRASGDMFELRLHADEMNFDPDDAFERLVIYRYRLLGDKVTRTEPVANHARGFVEEWLEMPWVEAAAQSDPAQDHTLEAVHRRYQVRFKDTTNYISWTSGPVQACTSKDHFQVTMMTEQNRVIAGKPGGESTPGDTYYFQLQQNANGYQLLAVSATSDPSCNGPDLMKTH